jgi:hypothetical protein
VDALEVAPDLFGDVMPVAVVRRGRRPARAHPAAAELEELREQIVAALAEMRSAVEDAVEEVREALARVEIVDGGGDVNCAINVLDEAVTDAVNAVRRELGAW